jgi:hypothetical protein
MLASKKTDKTLKKAKKKAPKEETHASLIARMLNEYRDLISEKTRNMLMWWAEWLAADTSRSLGEGRLQYIQQLDATLGIQVVPKSTKKVKRKVPEVLIEAPVDPEPEVALEDASLEAAEVEPPPALEEPLEEGLQLDLDTEVVADTAIALEDLAVYQEASSEEPPTEEVAAPAPPVHHHRNARGAGGFSSKKEREFVQFQPWMLDPSQLPKKPPIRFPRRY